MKRNTEFSRRKFVGGMLRGALVAAVAPNFIPLRVLAGENTPSKKIQLGHIGVGEDPRCRLGALPRLALVSFAGGVDGDMDHEGRALPLLAADGGVERLTLNDVQGEEDGILWLDPLRIRREDLRARIDSEDPLKELLLDCLVEFGAGLHQRTPDCRRAVTSAMVIAKTPPGAR